MSRERREHARYRLWFPVQLSGESMQDGMAMGHNASQKGLLIACQTTLALGSRVKLTFQLSPQHKPQSTVEGRVVRSDPNTEDPYGLWPFRVAIELDEPVPELEAILKEHGTVE